MKNQQDKNDDEEAAPSKQVSSLRARLNQQNQSAFNSLSANPHQFANLQNQQFQMGAIPDQNNSYSLQTLLKSPKKSKSKPREHTDKLHIVVEEQNTNYNGHQNHFLPSVFTNQRQTLKHGQTGRGTTPNDRTTRNNFIRGNNGNKPAKVIERRDVYSNNEYFVEQVIQGSEEISNLIRPYGLNVIVRKLFTDRLFVQQLARFTFTIQQRMSERRDLQTLLLRKISQIISEMDTERMLQQRLAKINQRIEQRLNRDQD